MIPSRQFFKLGVAYIPLFGSELILRCNHFHLSLMLRDETARCLLCKGFFAYGFQRLSRGAGDSLLFSCNFLFFVFTQSNFITFFIRNHCFLFLRVFYVQLQVSPFLVFRLRFAVALSVRIQVCRLFKNYIDVFQ
ncbi:hypothetical protein ACP275_10G115600 [Erythranthe tilingii]